MCKTFKVKTKQKKINYMFIAKGRKWIKNKSEYYYIKNKQTKIIYKCIKRNSFTPEPLSFRLLSDVKKNKKKTIIIWMSESESA